GVHQEAAGARHMQWLLTQQGRLKPKPSLRPAPEVMRLRFDSTRSPLDTIPRDLRGRLFKIYLHHAEGALKREGGHWRGFDPLEEEAGISAQPAPGHKNVSGSR
ncbi:MAG: creatininase family protein, partial [Candidatus Aminicenantes bacterium]|nr:creatininase family protein [Candidatus Aminicenantes bacterium]